MSANRIAGRYAKSLIQIAQEKQNLESVKDDILFFNKVAENREFTNVLKSPIITPGKKRSIMEAIFKGKISDLTYSFMDIVIRKGRESFLEVIASEFMVQYRKIKHVSSVKIKAAQPLSQEALKQIEERLLASNITDEKLDIQTTIDESLIGGFVVEVGDKRYDSSVKRKLELVKKEFDKNLYTKGF